MSLPPGPTPDDTDRTRAERPRPSWGQPAPTDPNTTPLDVAAAEAGRQGQPAYGDSYSQPTGPYGGATYGAPQPAPPPAWPNQMPNQPAWGQQAWNQPSPAQYGQDLGRHEQAYAQMYGEKPRHGMAIAALVLGILTALFAIFPVGSYAAVVSGVLAVIFGIVGARRTSGKGMAISGLVLGGLGLVVAILASIFWTRVFIDTLEVLNQCTEQTGASSGPAFDRCVNARARDINPFD